uniref:cysteine dioxygenase n=1 Tax=Oryza sativa subsp. japonica TaxID=39947 RepID=Q7XDV0_ORYSJ|nr:hypothetical protein LOC_Os10g31340 [Oryza sativa Japonica Group]
MPLLLGVYVFTDRPPRLPPTGASACTAGLYAAVVGRLRLHRPACLRRCRLVFPPARLAFMPPLLGVYVFTDWLAFAAADWCFRLHGWPLCRRCWASTSSPTGRLVCRRLVLPPARLAFMPPLLGVYVFTDRLAFAAADWCFRLHGWPIMPPLLGVYVFTDRPPRPPPTGVSACTAGLLCRRCWASTSSPTGLPSPPPTGVSACTADLYAAVVGRLRLHRPACLRRRRLVFPPARLAFMPPLLGVYVFTDRLAFAAADWCFRLHGWPLCRRCWASTSSPTGRLVCRRLVLPPARPTYYAAVVGRLRLHRPAASTAADWCFRLHGWPLCCRCWASTSSPTGRRIRR